MTHCEHGNHKPTCEKCAILALTAECERLRAELADAKALLRDVEYSMAQEESLGLGIDAVLVARIRAALSDKPAPTNTSDKP